MAEMIHRASGRDYSGRHGTGSLFGSASGYLAQHGTDRRRESLDAGDKKFNSRLVAPTFPRWFEPAGQYSSSRSRRRRCMAAAILWRLGFRHRRRGVPDHHPAVRRDAGQAVAVPTEGNTIDSPEGEDFLAGLSIPHRPPKPISAAACSWAARPGGTLPQVDFILAASPLSKSVALKRYTRVFPGLIRAFEPLPATSTCAIA